MSRYVYIAGPYTGGEEANVARALAAATKLLGAALYPYVPHLSHYWEAQHAHPYEVWMELDFGWVRRCDAVLRLPGASSGADREVTLAERLGLPVFYAVDAVIDWARATPSPSPAAPEARLAAFAEKYAALDLALAYGNIVPEWTLAWRRRYADGALSDRREVEAPTLAEVVSAAEEWEADNDLREPQHASPATGDAPRGTCSCETYTDADAEDATESCPCCDAMPFMVCTHPDPRAPSPSAAPTNKES